MEAVIQLLNDKYKGWTFGGMQKVDGAYKQIIHQKHCGDFLLLRFEKNDEKEYILLCEGKDNFILMFPFEQSKRILLETKYSSPCEDEDSESLNEFCLQYLNDSEEERNSS